MNEQVKKMTLNDIVTLLKEGLDKQFFDLDQTVWMEDEQLYWQMTSPSADFEDGMSDVDAAILQTLVRHNIFSPIGDKWYRINPPVVQTIYDQLNRRKG